MKETLFRIGSVYGRKNNMIDIVNFDGEGFDLGFSNVYKLKDFSTAVSSDNLKTKNILERKDLDFLILKCSNRMELTQVHMKIANKREIGIAFNFNEVLKSKDKGSILRNMNKYVRLCRRDKVKIIIASFAENKYEQRAPLDLISFGRFIGMTGKEAKEALNFKKKEDDVRIID